MQTNPRSSHEIAEAMIRRAESANGVNIWHSLYAPALAEIHEPSGDEPHSIDVVRECDRTEEIASAPMRLAYCNAIYGARP